MDALSKYLVVYGVLALSHIAIQIIFGHFEYRKQKSLKFKNFNNGHYPTITVVVPSYNENPELLRECLDSVAKQEYTSNIEVYVIDDCSKNREELMPIYNDFKQQGFHIILSDKNVGKRDSQKKAFDLARNEIIVTIDSDTVIEAPNGLVHMVQQFKNPEVGAITGDVRVINKKKNLLTRIISYRYWTAFHQERAAQSLFNVLMCCSGPFSAYRKSIIDKVKEKYVAQKFLGKKCTYGDDRHLTNLVLEEGHKVVFDNKAIAYTNVPENLSDYIKQQTRWNKSFYREMFWTLKHMYKHHVYMMYDMIFQFVLPFMLIVALAGVFYQVATKNIFFLWQYITLLVVIALVRCIYGMFRTRDIGFLTFVVYGFIHILVLIPVRIKALLTLSDMKWGTR